MRRILVCEDEDFIRDFEVINLQRSGYTGYTVQTYRNVYDAEGNLLRSAPEARSVYRSRSAIVLVGAEEPCAPEDAPPEETAPPEEVGEGQEALAPDPEVTYDPLPLRDLEQFQ